MIYIRFEYGAMDIMSEDIGPFEYIQATYDWLQASPDGETNLAHFHDGFWWTPDGNHYSDYVIFSA